MFKANASDNQQPPHEMPLILEAKLSNVEKWAGCLPIGLAAVVVYLAFALGNVLTQSALRGGVMLLVFAIGMVLIWFLERGPAGKAGETGVAKGEAQSLRIDRLEQTPLIHQRGFWAGMRGEQRQQDYAQDILRQLQRLPKPLPRTFVHHDAELQRRLEHHGLIPNQLEPEFVLPSSPIRGSHLVLIF